MPLMGHKGHTEMLSSLAEGTPIYEAVHDPRVKAIVCVSAHHESKDGSTVLIQADKDHKGLLYDYGGFPPQCYEYKMENQGSPELAARIQGLLQARNISSQLESGRGYDHGVFVPLLVLKAPQNIPIVQVSLRDQTDTDFHLLLGKALAPLRKEGILLFGSGMLFHNM